MSTSQGDMPPSSSSTKPETQPYQWRIFPDRKQNTFSLRPRAGSRYEKARAYHGTTGVGDFYSFEHASKSLFIQRIVEAFEMEDKLPPKQDLTLTRTAQLPLTCFHLCGSHIAAINKLIKARTKIDGPGKFVSRTVEIKHRFDTDFQYIDSPSLPNFNSVKAASFWPVDTVHHFVWDTSTQGTPQTTESLPIIVIDDDEDNTGEIAGTVRIGNDEQDGHE